MDIKCFRKSIVYAIAVVFCMIFFLFIVGCGGTQTQPQTETQTETQTEMLKLTLSHFSAANHHLNTEVCLPFAEEVKEKTEGRVEITVHPSAILVDANDHYDAAVTGVVDIAEFIPGYTRGRFPAISVLDLPFVPPIFSSSAHAAKSVAELFKTEPVIQDELGELKDVKILFFGTAGLGQILLNKPFSSIESLQGLKLRSPGPTQDEVIKAFGAIPVTLPMTDLYDALERGVVDGALTDYSPIPAYHLHEVITGVVECNIYAMPIIFAMNLDKWEQISSADQEVILELGEKYGVKLGEEYDKASLAGKENVQAQGLDIYYPTEEALLEMKNEQQHVIDKWIQEMEQKGIPGEDIYNKIIDIADKCK